jgi:hypothetical protein
MGTNLILDALILSCDNDDYLDALLTDFVSQIEIPNQVIIIDNGINGSSGLVQKYINHGLPINYMKMDQNIGVNAGWMLGIWVSGADVISILNYDIRIPPDFFKKIKFIFQNQLDVGYIIPLTVKALEEVPSEPDAFPSEQESCEREGWAFSIRRNICLNVPPIPESVFTFYGDDYLHLVCGQQKFRSVREKALRIFHHFSPTVNRLNVLSSMGNEASIMRRWYQDFSGLDARSEWNKRFKKEENLND